MKECNKKGLTLLSVMMMLSMAIIGSIIIIDNEDSSASGSGTAADPYTAVSDYSVLMSSTDVYVFVGAMFGSTNYLISPPDVLGNSDYTSEAEFMEAGFTTGEVNGGIAFYGEILQGTYTFSLINQNSAENNTVTIHAVSSAASTTYTVTYDTNGGNTISSQTVSAGTVITLPTPTRSGCQFQGWYNGSTYVANDGETYTVSGNVTLTAHWLYKITYAGNGGTPTSSYTTITPGQSTTLITPTRTGYEFDGWYNGSTLVGAAGASYTPTSSVTLTAHWKPVITFNNQSVVVGSVLNYTDVVPSGNTMTTNVSWLTGSGTSLTGTAPSTVGDYSVTITSGGASKTVTFHVVTELVITNSPSNGMIVYAIG